MCESLVDPVHHPSCGPPLEETYCSGTLQHVDCTAYWVKTGRDTGYQERQ